MKTKYIVLLLCLWGTFTPALAQKWVSPNYDNHRLDYRDLGYPEVSEIPADDARISALLCGASGYIYGATSGKSASHFFLYDRYINKVRLLGKIPGALGVHHAMVQDRSGKIYLGSGLNLLDEIPLTQDFPGGHRQIEVQLWNDVKAYHAGFAGGKLWQYDPSKHDEAVFLPDAEASLKDLGTVQARNSVYALAIDQQRDVIYGITYPAAHFFSYQIASATLKDHGALLDTMVFSGPERTWRSVPRALLVLNDGKVLTSGNEGFFTVFDPATQQFQHKRERIPGEYWESWNYTGYPVIEQLIKDGQGQIWGATSDGFVFRYDPAADKVYNLGKPRVSRRIRAMTLGLDGQLYLLAGEIDEPVKLFSYNTLQHEGFVNYSYLSVDRSPYYQKRGYQFEAMATGPDNSIFIGESDRRGKLFIFTPGGLVFDGGLNPKNPR